MINPVFNSPSESIFFKRCCNRLLGGILTKFPAGSRIVHRGIQNLGRPFRSPGCTQGVVHHQMRILPTTDFYLTIIIVQNPSKAGWI